MGPHQVVDGLPALFELRRSELSLALELCLCLPEQGFGAVLEDTGGQSLELVVQLLTRAGQLLGASPVIRLCGGEFRPSCAQVLAGRVPLTASLVALIPELLYLAVAFLELDCQPCHVVRRAGGTGTALRSQDRSPPKQHGQDSDEDDCTCWFHAFEGTCPL